SLLVFDVPAVPPPVRKVFQSIATAGSGYVEARQLGGDAGRMAALIAGQTRGVLLTLPVVLLIADAALRWRPCPLPPAGLGAGRQKARSGRSAGKGAGRFIGHGRSQTARAELSRR